MTTGTARDPIRVLLVDDSAVALAVLERILGSAPDVRVVGTARTGPEALGKIPSLRPDVICIDYHMPGMDGLELTQAVMSRFPLPILVLSASFDRSPESHRVFHLLTAGAVDVYPKPSAASMPGRPGQEPALIEKIRLLAGVMVFRKHSAGPTSVAIESSREVPPDRRSRIVGIGASTGGPRALQSILTRLPESFAAPIVCVQHISSGFLAGLVGWLNDVTPLVVKIAESGEAPAPGRVYFPPEDRHLEVDRGGRFSHGDGPSLDGNRPSVTMTFRSLAERYTDGALGVLLTGMGGDGAQGLLEIAAAGGATVAQDQETSVVFGMPRQAIVIGAAQQVLPLERIPAVLLNHVAVDRPVIGGAGKHERRSRR